VRSVQLAVVVAGFALEVAVWRVVATGRASLWGPMVGVFAVPGIVAAIVLPPVGSGEHALAVALTVGIVSGIVLWAATIAFVAVAVRWQPFRRAVAEQYARAAEVSLPVAVAISLLIAVPSEELFWRNLVQRRLGVPGELIGAVAAWTGYVVANVASGSLPFVAAAIVGGAVWGGLAWWTGGIAAGLASHGVWTTLMLVHPPASGRVPVGVTPG
jgi:membrane protease YdiL (CAAX protease family)